jgi:mannosyltransferase
VRSREAWIVASITAAAALIRFATLGHQSFDHDEAVTALRVLRPGLGDTLSVVAHLERSPPLYYVLAWLWAKVFGTGEVGLRSLSALVGTLTVPGAYLAARELASRRAGEIAAVLVAVNPYLVWYSQEARAYALLALFATWGLWLLARALRDPSTRNLALWAGVSVLALCSHYFAVFVIAPEAALLLAYGRRRRRAVAAVIPTLAVGLALVPLALAQEAGGRQDSFTNVALIGRLGATGLKFLASEEPDWLTGSSAVDDLQRFAVVVGGAVAVAALILLLRWGSGAERRGAAIAGGVGLASLLAPFVLALAGADFVDPRNLIGSLGPLLVAAGIAFGVVRARLAGTVAAVATAGLFAIVLVAVNVSAQLDRPDWRGAAEAVGPPRGPRVMIVPHNGDDGMAYYLHAAEFDRRPFRGGLRVREIDALSTRFAVTPPGRGFKLVELRRMAPTFYLRRYRSPVPVSIRPSEVTGRRVLTEPSKVLVDGLQRPAAGAGP